MPVSFDTSYTSLDDHLYSSANPRAVANPEILLLNDQLCEDIGIEQAALTAEILAGQQLLEEPFAQAYAGHQYGQFTMLGDGRAMVLGEHIHEGEIRYPAERRWQNSLLPTR